MSRPCSEVRMLYVPELSIAQDHTFRFNSQTSQTNYFIGKTLSLYQNVSFIRYQKVLRLEVNMEDTEFYNYLMFRNKNKWYYAFILDKEYINDNVTEFTIEIDVMQTYHFDYTIQESYVDRCHSHRWDEKGYPIINAVNEELEIGELIEVNRSTVYDYYKKGSILITSSTPLGVCSNSGTGGGGSSDTQGENIINSARKLIGKPYVWGGNYPPLGGSEGTDCSGLCQWAYNDNNISISRTTYTQIKEGTEVTKENLRLGDLVFSRFSSPNVPEHVFLYSGKDENGNLKCVEAMRSGTNILEHTFNWVEGMRARRLLKDIATGGDGSKPSERLIYFVKEKEGFSSTIYSDSGGVKTLGYGLTGDEITGLPIPLSESLATKILYQKMRDVYGKQIHKALKEKLGREPKQREYDCFSDLAYNCGVHKTINGQPFKLYVSGVTGVDLLQSFKTFVITDAVGNVLQGLIKRRENEYNILTGLNTVQGYDTRPYITVLGTGKYLNDNGGYGSPISPDW